MFENWMPSVSENGCDLDRDHMIGAIILMETVNGAGTDAWSIADIYDEVSRAVDDDRALVVTDKENTPQAYAIWTKNDERTVVTRQLAPFGDHAKLLQALQSILSGQILARHDDSARPLQELCA